MTELPPLPEPVKLEGPGWRMNIAGVEVKLAEWEPGAKRHAAVPWFTADQLRSYAEQVRAAERERPRCATCAHWKRDEYDIGHGLELGKCCATPMFWDSTQWDELGDSRTFKPDVTATAFAQDGSDYKAWLFTKAEHGCTMHSAIRSAVLPPL